MKTQVIVIHGGDTFDTYQEYIEDLKEIPFDLSWLSKKNWKALLPETLGSDYDVAILQMPNKQNARYLEWKIWFDKVVPFMQENCIIVAHSLGGIFITKYLSENNVENKPRAVFMVAAPFDDEDSDFSLVDFRFEKGFDMFTDQAKEIYIYHSKDDPVVGIEDFDKYKKALPKATFRLFEDRQHFSQSDFPELVEDIKSAIIPS